MSSFNLKTKPCQYCGKEIYWNVLKNQYDELTTKQKHTCEKYSKPTFTDNKEKSYDKPYRAYSKYNKEPKPPVSNTFELLEGSPKECRMQYQYLCDLIEKVKGKIHGSQSHITDTGLKMLIYFEVPVGERDTLHKRFEMFLNNPENKSQ